MARKREPGVKVWCTVPQDVKLKLDILVKRTKFPIWWHFKKALEEYTKDVRPDDVEQYGPQPSFSLEIGGK